MAVTPPTHNPEPTESGDKPAVVHSAQSSASAASRGRVISDYSPRTQHSSRAVVIAVAAHLAIALVLLRAITFDTGFRDYFGLETTRTVQERITLVETQPEPEPEPEPAPRDPAVPAPVNAPSRGPVLAEPDVASVPGEVLVAPVDSGPLVNRLPANEAAVVGLVPRADERLWTMADLRSLRAELRAGNGAVTGSRELDSVITWTLMAARDSLDSLNVLRSVGPTTASWTRKDSKGGTWGMDASGLRLGKVTIPSALLGLLPMGAQQAMSGNPTTMERNRRLSYAQSDIARFRESGPGNDHFKMLVAELRERRDRERAQRRSQAAAKATPLAPGSQNETPP